MSKEFYYKDLQLLYSEVKYLTQFYEIKRREFCHKTYQSDWLFY